MCDKTKEKPEASVASIGMVIWPPLDEIDGETEELVRSVENEWAWAWPGWQWVANRINREFENNRTAQACRAKYNRINAKRMKNISQLTTNLRFRAKRDSLERQSLCNAVNNRAIRRREAG